MSECWEIWALNYDYLFTSGQHNAPALDLASQFPTQQNGGISTDGKVWTIHLRSGVKWQDGQPLTADRRGLHLQLRDQERHSRSTPPTSPASRVGQGGSTRQRCSSCARTPWPPASWRGQSVPILPRAYLVARLADGGGLELRGEAAARGQRPVPGGRLQEGQLHRDGPQPRLLGPQAGGRQDLL